MKLIPQKKSRFAGRAIELFAAATFSLLAGTSAFAGFLSAGNRAFTLNHGGAERSAIIHVPPHAAEKHELAIVLNFHGGGGHGANAQAYSLMDRLADQENFLVVYPNGSGRFGKRLLTWNAGTCCGYASINTIDDVGFAAALIRKLAEIVPIDRRRIYATGLSNGGMMAHR